MRPGLYPPPRLVGSALGSSMTRSPRPEAFSVMPAWSFSATSFRSHASTILRSGAAGPRCAASGRLVLADRALPARDAGVVEVVDVRRPIAEPVKDVRVAYTIVAPRVLGLLPQPLEQVLAHDHVERGRHLVEQQDLERADQPEEELRGTPPLAVRDLVHAPLGVHAEQLHQLVAALVGNSVWFAAIIEPTRMSACSGTP